MVSSLSHLLAYLLSSRECQSTPELLSSSMSSMSALPASLIYLLWSPFIMIFNCCQHYMWFVTSANFHGKCKSYWVSLAVSWLLALSALSALFDFFFLPLGTGLLEISIVWKTAERKTSMFNFVHHSPVISAEALISRATIHRLCSPERTLYN